MQHISDSAKDYAIKKRLEKDLSNREFDLCKFDFQAGLDVSAKRIKLLTEALEKITKWELPETGEFWDEEKTRPASYESCFGSNGVRDYFKSLALTTLKQTKNN